MQAPGHNDTGGVDDDHDGLTEMEWLEREQEKEMIQLAMERSLNEFHHVVQNPTIDSDYHQHHQHHRQQPMAERDFSYSQDRQALHHQNEAMEPDIFHDRRHSYSNNNNNNNSNRDDRFSSSLGPSGMNRHPNFERDPYQPLPSRDDNRFSPRQDAIRRDPRANQNHWPESPANQYTSRDRFDTVRHIKGGSMRNIGSGRDAFNNNSRSPYQRGGSFRAIEEVTETVIDSPHRHHPSYDRMNEPRHASHDNLHYHHDRRIAPVEAFNDYGESYQAPHHRQTPPSDYGRRTPPRDGRRTPPRYRESTQQVPSIAAREGNHATPNMMTPRDQARDAVLQTARQHLSVEEAELVDQALRLGRTTPADIVQSNREGRLSSHSMPHVAGTRRSESSLYGMAYTGQHRSRSFDDVPTPEERRQWEENAQQPATMATQITMDFLGRAQASEHLSQEELDGIEQALTIENSSQHRQGRDNNHPHPQNQHRQSGRSRDHRRNASMDSMAIAKANIQQAMADNRLSREEARELMHAFEVKNTDENNDIPVKDSEQLQPLQERLISERASSPSSTTNSSSALLDTGELQQQQQTQSDNALKGAQSMQQVSDADLPPFDHASGPASSQEEEGTGEGEEISNSIVKDLSRVDTKEAELEQPPKSGEGEDAIAEELKNCIEKRNTGEDSKSLSEKGREEEEKIVAPFAQPKIEDRGETAPPAGGKQSNEMTTSSRDRGSHQLNPSNYRPPSVEDGTSSTSVTKAKHEGSEISLMALQSEGENSKVQSSSLSSEAIQDKEQSVPPSEDCNAEAATDTTLITDSDQSRNSNSQQGARDDTPKAAVTDENRNNIERIEAEVAPGASSSPSGAVERQMNSEHTDIDHHPSIEAMGITEQLAVAKIAGDLSTSQLEASAGVDLDASAAYLDTLSAENKSDDGSTILPVAVPLATPATAPRYATRESQAPPLDSPDEDQLPVSYDRRNNSRAGAMDDHDGAPFSGRRALDVRVVLDAQDYAFDQQQGQREWRDNTGSGPNTGEFSENYNQRGRFDEPAQQHRHDVRGSGHAQQPAFDRWSDHYGLDRAAAQSDLEASQQPRMTHGDNRQRFASDVHGQEGCQYRSVEQGGLNHQGDRENEEEAWENNQCESGRAGVPAQVVDPRDSRETWVSSNNTVSSLGESTQFSLFSGHLPYQKQGSFRNSKHYDRALSEHNNWRQSNPTPMTHSILETSGHRHESNPSNPDHAKSTWQHQQLSSPQLSYPGVPADERARMQRGERDRMSGLDRFTAGSGAMQPREYPQEDEYPASSNIAGEGRSQTPPISYTQGRIQGSFIDQPRGYIQGRDRLPNRDSFSAQLMEYNQERDRATGHGRFVGGRDDEHVENYSQERRASEHDLFEAELKRALFESIQMQQTPLAESGCEQDPPYAHSFPPEALLSREQLDHINRALAAPVEEEQMPRSSSNDDEVERNRVSSAGTAIRENERLATRSALLPLNQTVELQPVTDAEFERALQEAKDEEERQSLLLARQLQEEEERRLPVLPQNRASLSSEHRAIDSTLGQDSTLSSMSPRLTSQVGAVRSSSPARARHPLENSLSSLPPNRGSTRNLASTVRDRQTVEDSFASLPHPQLEDSSRANERSRRSLEESSRNSSNSLRRAQPLEHARRPIRDDSFSELATGGTTEKSKPSNSKDTVGEKKSKRDSKVLGSVAKLGRKGVGSLLQTMKRSSVRRVSLTAGDSADQDEAATETTTGDLTTETLLQIDRAVVKGVICKLNGAVKMGNEATLFHADGGPESDGFDVAVKVYKRALGLGSSNQEERNGKDLSQFRNISSSEQLELWTIKEYRNLKRARKAGVPAPAALMARQNILFMHFVGENGVPAPQLGQLELRRGHKRWKALYKQIIEAIGR